MIWLNPIRVNTTEEIPTFLFELDIKNSIMFYFMMLKPKFHNRTHHKKFMLYFDDVRYF